MSYAFMRIPQYQWELDAETGTESTVACHSLIADGVLCRWRGMDEPAGAKKLAALPDLIVALVEIRRGMTMGDMSGDECARIAAKALEKTGEVTACISLPQR